LHTEGVTKKWEVNHGEPIPALKGRATRMGRTFGAQDGNKRRSGRYRWRLRFQSPEFIQSPEGATYPYSPALQGRVFQTLRNIS
jgi:hypothetical protein